LDTKSYEEITMSARPTHDLCIKTGEYTDRTTGEQKARWLTIGTVFKHEDGGTSIKLDALPIGIPAWEGWVNVFPRRDRQQGQGQQGQQTQQQTQQGGYPRQPQTPAGGFQAPQGNGQGNGQQGGFDDQIPF
jgi:hypothetical protein